MNASITFILFCQGRTNATTAGGDGAGAGGDDGEDQERRRKKTLPADKGPLREESEEKDTLQREEGDHVGKVMNTINM